MSRRLRVITRDGREHELAVAGDITLMEALRDNGVDELLALCGGCCSCATCDVIFLPEDFARLPNMSEDEDDLLDSSEHRQETSRLSCQVPVDALADQCQVCIAPED